MRERAHMGSITLTISTLSTQGEGIARVEGKATFVPFTLPGETWSVDLVDRKKNFDRALPIELIQSTADTPPRNTPSCPHFGVCGGCQLQHMLYEDQLDWKRCWLRETFRRVGHLEVDPQNTVSSPEWEYRNKLTLSLQEEEGGYILAFHHIYQPNKPVSVRDCPVAHPLIRLAIPKVLQALDRFKPKLGKHRDIYKSRVQFRVLDSQLNLVFEDVHFRRKDEIRFVDAISLSNLPLLEIDFGDACEAISNEGSADDIEDSSVSSNSFFQINDSVREKLYNYILDLPYPAKNSVLEGYCGVGWLTCSLAQRFERVTGVELNRSAASDAQRLVQYEGLSDRVHIHNQPLERFLRDSKERYDCLILNPPRAGLSNEVRLSLVHLSPPEIVIVSCHPAALARDVHALTEQGYRILSLQPFDMFPQTYHLETVVRLRCS